MARSDVALARARFAYERAHVIDAALGVAIAGAIAALAVGFHRTTQATWVIAGVLAAALAALAWRGGAFRRGSRAGVLAGLPPMLAPVLVFALGHDGHCPDCQMAPTLTCLLTCFGTSALVGTLVGHVAARDAAPLRYGLAAIASAALTGLLGCTTTGLGGAVGVVVGLVAGGVTGWVVAGRTAAA